MRVARTYLVFFDRGTSTEQFVGYARSLRECRRAAWQHSVGRLTPVAEHEYESVFGEHDTRFAVRKPRKVYGMPPAPQAAKPIRVIRFGSFGRYSAIEVAGDYEFFA